MDYRKLIEAYKNGSLDEQQNAQVSADIEKHEAISDYLMENAEIPGLDEISFDGHADMQQSEADNSRHPEALGEQINQYIRRAFVKAGITVGALVLAITLAVMFVLPHAVDLFYYNPGEIAGKTATGLETNRISLDMAVYTEMNLPGSYRDRVSCESDGYGSYSLYIQQTSSYSGVFNDTAGKLTRNKLTVYNPNLFKHYPINAFVSVPELNSLSSGTGAAGSYDDAMETLQNLNEESYYMAYVTLDKVMSYRELAKWCAANPAYLPEWCAVCVKGDNGFEQAAGGIGFLYDASCSGIGFDSDKYPLLTLFSVYEKNLEPAEIWEISEKDMTQHMVSMLRYTADHMDFSNMMNNSVGNEADARELANNIESNGLYVYGFTLTGKKAELNHLMSDKHISYIYTTPVA